ncbi:MAG TPA: type II secretion system protein GspM, partial [Gammaproteobacteria bacterium]|nr:type II secretion system protein GspM [Gammaproteobacteria bacterium]
QFERRRAASDPTARVFHADTAALAGADLQKQLDSLVAAEGGKVLSSAFRDLTADGSLTPIAVTVRLRCSMEALLRILHGLENRPQVLFVENLSVQARQRADRPQRQEDGDLEVEIDVVGFLATRAVP